MVVAGASIGGCADSIQANCHEGPEATVEETTYEGSLRVDLDRMTRVAAGVYVEDLTVGTGAEARAGSLLRVRYAGWLWDGRQFDSGLNLNFELGAGNVISGWELGVAGMREGGVRKLVLAPSRGFGPCDEGPIPGNSVLVFEVELLQVG